MEQSANKTPVQQPQATVSTMPTYVDPKMQEAWLMTVMTWFLNDAVMHDISCIFNRQRFNSRRVMSRKVTDEYFNEVDKRISEFPEKFGGTS